MALWAASWAATSPPARGPGRTMAISFYVGPRVARLEPGRFPVMRDGLGGAPLPGQGQAEIAVGLGVARTHAQRRLEVPDSLVHLSPQAGPEAGMFGGVGRWRRLGGG